MTEQGLISAACSVCLLLKSVIAAKIKSRQTEVCPTDYAKFDVAMKRIVVVGAGFGGLEAVTELDGMFRRDRNVEILLLSDQNYLLFTPLLPQIASSYTDPRHIVQAVREIRGRKRFRFRREAVRAVDA